MSGSLSPPDPLFTFRGHMGQVNCMYMKEETNSELLYIGTNEGIVHIWDLKDKREKTQHKVGDTATLSILYIDNLFITQQRGESIKFWKEVNNYWKLQKVFNHDYTGFCKMDYINEHLILPNNNSLTFFNKTINKEIHICPEEDIGNMMCLKCLNKNNYILTCYESGYVYLWDFKQKVIKKSKLLSNCPMAVDYDENVDEGIIGSTDNILIKFTIGLTNNKDVSVVVTNEITNPGVSSISIREDGKLCVIGCWDGRIRYFSMKKLKLLCVLCHHEGPIQAVLFTRQLSFYEKGMLLVGGKDGRVSLWNLYTDKN